MTDTLEKAWNQVITLPADKQDTIGNIILEEIEDSLLWDSQFNNSQIQLSKIASKVKNDIIAGNFKQKGFGDL